MTRIEDGDGGGSASNATCDIIRAGTRVGDGDGGGNATCDPI